MYAVDIVREDAQGLLTTKRNFVWSSAKSSASLTGSAQKKFYKRINIPKN